jgi:hypothetical protein
MIYCKNFCKCHNVPPDNYKNFFLKHGSQLSHPTLPILQTLRSQTLWNSVQRQQESLNLNTGGTKTKQKGESQGCNAWNAFAVHACCDYIWDRKVADKTNGI